MRLLGGIGNAFSDRNFRIYSVGSITSWITYFVQNITFSWVAWDATHSTTWLALVSAATTITTIVVLPLGGVLADRHDRYRILLAAYALDWAKSAVLAALALSGHLTLPLICISAVARPLHLFEEPAWALPRQRSTACAVRDHRRALHRGRPCRRRGLCGRRQPDQGGCQQAALGGSLRDVVDWNNLAQTRRSVREYLDTLDDAA